MADPMDIANAAAAYAQDDQGRPRRPCPTCGVIQAGMDQPMYEEPVHPEPKKKVTRKDNIKDLEKVFGGGE